jgi:hypothetical protein
MSEIDWISIRHRVQRSVGQMARMCCTSISLYRGIYLLQNDARARAPSGSLILEVKHFAKSPVIWFFLKMTIFSQKRKKQNSSERVEIWRIFFHNGPLFSIMACINAP